MAQKSLRTVSLVAAAFAGWFFATPAEAATPLSTINGTVSDNAGGSGVAKVDAYLLRSNNGVDEYWANRSGVWGWGTAATAIPTTLTSGAWSVTASNPSGTQFPSGANWLDGTYRVRATAFDNAGNSATSTVNTFTVDSVVPATSVVVTPANNANVSTLPSITGTATDNSGGSGIGSVNVYLRRRRSGVDEFWGNRSGVTGWGSTSVTIPATVSGNNWSVPGSLLPSGANLTIDQYLVNAWAYDRAGNGTNSVVNVFNVIAPDTTPPTSSVVTTPANNAYVSSLPSIAGTATDNAGGSGIGTVNVYLRRRRSGVDEFWGNRSGVTGWGSTSVFVSATVSGNNWSVPGSLLPSGANLTLDQYLVNAWAYDKAGNTGKNSSVNVFNIIAPDTTSPTSSVVTSPANNAYISTLPSITGTATDNSGGSGIGTVNVYLRRRVSGSDEFWGTRSGVTGWGSTTVFIPATVSGGTYWTVPGSSLPSGANLTLGMYLVNAWAYDNAGNPGKNSSVNVFNIIAPDTTSPTSSVVTSPANNAYISTLPSITGTATDNSGGSGIGTVNVYLRRRISGSDEFWGTRSGVTGWGSTTVFIPATVSGGTYWTVPGSSLPSGANLTLGMYLVNAWAYDNAGNPGKNSSVNVFNIIAPDTTSPTSSVVTSPANNSGVVSLPSITGTATDNSGGSGIGTVNVYLRRRISGSDEFWGTRSGVTGWGSTTVFIPATVSGGTYWTVPGSSLPSGANLTLGMYLVNAWAYDFAGNPGRNSAVNTFNVINPDSTSPTSSVVTSPANNAIVTSLPSITGTATDNSGGSGIGTVNVYLRRRISGSDEFWGTRSGVTGWGGTAVTIPATVSGTNWTVPGSLLPSGSNLTNGMYLVNAWAYDIAGNPGKNSSVNTFTVNGAGVVAGGGISPVVLSSCSVNSGQSSITLVFTGAVSTASATDLLRYAVSVNGVETILESAASSRGGSGVILGFEEGALQAGDSVSVKYDLLDAQGRKISGKTTVTSS